MTADHVTLLGTKGGPAIRQPGPLPTASLLSLAGRTIVIDCGMGVTRSLVWAGQDLTEIDAVFITHLHSDHLLELGPLLYTAWTTGLRRKLAVFGPRGLAAYWRGFLDSMAYDRAIRESDEGRPPFTDLVICREYGAGPVADIGPIQVTALRVAHPPVEECYALRFDAGGKSAVFSADTRHFPPLADFAAGADILVHEAMLEKGVERLIARTPNADDRLRKHLHASHSTAAQAAEIARAAGVGHLALNHLVPADDPDVTKADWLAEIAPIYGGKVSVGQDGLRLEF